MCAPVRSVTTRTAKAARRTPAYRGFPVAYFVQTMADFKTDARKSADTRKANTNLMIAYAKAMTDDEVKAAAQYFAAMKWTPWIKVVEASTVPKTRIAGGMFLKLEGGETEPIGDRIIEVADDAERTETLRDPRSGFTAYVPTGSIKKGEALVTTRRRQDDALLGVPWRRFERAGTGAGDCRALAELHSPPAVRHAEGHAQRRVGRSHEAGRGEPDERGHAGHRRVHRVARCPKTSERNRRARKIAEK